jgi:hypothetical protein
MICSIQQPRYLPSDSYFDRIRQSDIHVVLNHVTLSKGDYVNRTRIKHKKGEPFWLTIPVEYGQPINIVKCPGNWRHTHAKSLYQAYPRLQQETNGVGCHNWFHRTYLVGVLHNTTDWLCERLGVTTDRISSTALGGDALGVKSELVLNICKEVGADVYLSGPNGKDYLDLPAFDKAGIEVKWHNYPVEQPVLSALHNLFTGGERVRDIAGDGISQGSRG